MVALVEEHLFGLLGDRALAGARKPGEPHAQRAVALPPDAVLWADKPRVPGNIGRRRDLQAFGALLALQLFYGASRGVARPSAPITTRMVSS